MHCSYISLILNRPESGKSYFFGKMDTAKELLHQIYQHKHKPKSGGAGIIRRRLLLRSLGNDVTDGASFLFSSLYQRILCSNKSCNILLARFLKLTRNENLIQYIVGLVEIEYQIQLAYTAEIAVQYLNKMMDNFKDFELIVISIDTHAEIEAGIPSVHNLVTSPLDKVAEFWPSSKNEPTKLTDDLSPLLLGVRRVPLGEPHLALAAD